MRRYVMQTFCPCLFEQIQVTNISQTQVAIIGGGLAGLHAAYLLHRAGVSFQLFEARDRLGGRILTVDEAGRAAKVGFDLGLTYNPALGIWSTNSALEPLPNTLTAICSMSAVCANAPNACAAWGRNRAPCD